MDTLGPIIGPSAATVECVEVLDVTLQPFGRELSSVLLQTEIRKDAEPEPIRVRHAAVGQTLDGTLALELPTHFFSLMEFPSQFSTLPFSLSDNPVQRTGATARAKPSRHVSEP